MHFLKLATVRMLIHMVHLALEHIFITTKIYWLSLLPLHSTQNLGLVKHYKKSRNGKGGREKGGRGGGKKTIIINNYLKKNFFRSYERNSLPLSKATGMKMIQI